MGQKSADMIAIYLCTVKVKTTSLNTLVAAVAKLLTILTFCWLSPDGGSVAE